MPDDDDDDDVEYPPVNGVGVGEVDADGVGVGVGVPDDDVENDCSPKDGVGVEDDDGVAGGAVFVAVVEPSLTVGTGDCAADCDVVAEAVVPSQDTACDGAAVCVSDAVVVTLPLQGLGGGRGDADTAPLSDGCALCDGRLADDEAVGMFVADADSDDDCDGGGASGDELGVSPAVGVTVAAGDDVAALVADGLVVGVRAWDAARLPDRVVDECIESE